MAESKSLTRYPIFASVLSKVRERIFVDKRRYRIRSYEVFNIYIYYFHNYNIAIISPNPSEIEFNCRKRFIYEKGNAVLSSSPSLSSSSSSDFLKEVICEILKKKEQEDKNNKQKIVNLFEDFALFSELDEIYFHLLYSISSLSQIRQSLRYFDKLHFSSVANPKGSKKKIAEFTSQSVAFVSTLFENGTVSPEFRAEFSVQRITSAWRKSDDDKILISLKARRAIHDSRFSQDIKESDFDSIVMSAIIDNRWFFDHAAMKEEAIAGLERLFLDFVEKYDSKEYPLIINHPASKSALKKLQKLDENNSLIKIV